MAKHLSALRGFRVSTVQYDGWMELEHHWRECDWTGGISDGSLPAIMRLAAAHAKVFDGKRQPRPEPGEPSALGSSIMSLWDPMLRAALEQNIVTGQPFVTGIPNL